MDEEKTWRVRVTRDETVEYHITAKNGHDAIALALGHAVQGHTSEKWGIIAGYKNTWRSDWVMTTFEEIKKD